MPPRLAADSWCGSFSGGRSTIGVALLLGVRYSDGCDGYGDASHAVLHGRQPSGVVAPSPVYVVLTEFDGSFVSDRPRLVDIGKGSFAFGRIYARDKGVSPQVVVHTQV